MRNLNRFQFTGRVGSVKEFGNGNVSLLVFSADDYRSGDEWVNQSYPMNVSFFGDSGQRIVKNVSKGDIVYVEGKVVVKKGDDGKYNTYLNGFFVDNMSSSGKDSDSKQTTSRKKYSRNEEEDYESEDEYDLDEYDI